MHPVGRRCEVPEEVYFQGAREGHIRGDMVDEYNEVFGCRMDCSERLKNCFGGKPIGMIPWRSEIRKTLSAVKLGYFNPTFAAIGVCKENLIFEQ